MLEQCAKNLSVCQIMPWQELINPLPVNKEQTCKSEMFTVSTNTGIFKFVGILGVCALRLVCLEDTDYLKNAKDGQERVYHSMHMPLLVIHWGTYCSN